MNSSLPFIIISIESTLDINELFEIFHNGSHSLKVIRSDVSWSILLWVFAIEIAPFFSHCSNTVHIWHYPYCSTMNVRFGIFPNRSNVYSCPGHPIYTPSLSASCSEKSSRTIVTTKYPKQSPRYRSFDANTPEPSPRIVDIPTLKLNFLAPNSISSSDDKILLLMRTGFLIHFKPFIEWNRW